MDERKGVDGMTIDARRLGDHREFQNAALPSAFAREPRRRQLKARKHAPAIALLIIAMLDSLPIAPRQASEALVVRRLVDLLATVSA